MIATWNIYIYDTNPNYTHYVYTYFMHVNKDTAAVWPHRSFSYKSHHFKENRVRESRMPVQMSWKGMAGRTCTLLSKQAGQTSKEHYRCSPAHRIVFNYPKCYRCAHICAHRGISFTLVLFFFPRWCLDSSGCPVTVSWASLLGHPPASTLDVPGV